MFDPHQHIPSATLARLPLFMVWCDANRFDGVNYRERETVLGKTKKGWRAD
jgi:hypothetical protein